MSPDERLRDPNAPYEFKPKPRRRRRRISTWQIAARLGAVVIAFLVLQAIYEISLVTVIMAPLLGLAFYEIGYIVVDMGARR